MCEKAKMKSRIYHDAWTRSERLYKTIIGSKDANEENILKLRKLSRSFQSKFETSYNLLLEKSKANQK